MMKNVLILLLCSKMAAAQNDSTRLVHVGFAYPLSTNGRDAKQFTNGGSFHALTGVSAGEKAFCISGISNVVLHNADGFILGGVINLVGRSTKGMQVAGVSNITRGNVKGLQMAGFNNIARNVSGMQLAGFSNIAKDSSTGIQVAGFSSIARISNTQISGFSNVSKQTTGAQIAGFANVCKNINGAQISGFANIAKEVKGTQVAGFINVAKKVTGTQISGFLNIADTSDYPIGLINIIKNGEQYIGATIDETGTGMLALRSGSKKMYGILAAGINFVSDDVRYGMEAGIGLHLPLRPWFRFKTEFTVLSLTNFTNGVFMRSSVRLLPAVKIAKTIELFAGPGFAFSNSPQHLGQELELQYVWSRRSKGTFYGLNIGGMAGLQVRL